MKTFTEPEINFMPLNAEENVMTAFLLSKTPVADNVRIINITRATDEYKIWKTWKDKDWF